MPDLSPFRGLRYDPATATDPATLLCPPYDVISAAERELLVELDPRNAVRLELPVPGNGTDAYASAAHTLASWLEQGVLRRDERPLVYVYEQRYRLSDATEGVARSFFCRIRLEKYGPQSAVRPHEHTLSGPKEDRFKLLSAVRTNVSPVLFLYDDGAAGNSSARLLAELTATPPDLSAAGPAGVGQRLWALDPARSPAAAQLLELAARGPLTIADGHHRYETALRYRSQADAPSGADHVLALLYESHSGGLALLPWHRLVKGTIDVADLREAAGRFFTVREVSDAAELQSRLGQGSEPGTIGFWTRAGGGLLSVQRDRVEPLLPSDASATVRWLDVSVLSVTLSAMIGSGEGDLSSAGRLDYTSDARAAIEALEAGRADVCFLLRPTPIEAVLEVAAEGGFMPPKSTFFHPKAATGLVFNPLAE